MRSDVIIRVETLKRFWSYVSANKRLLKADLVVIEEQLKKDLLANPGEHRSIKIVPRTLVYQFVFGVSVGIVLFYST